jgi:predicted nucleic-acid-binding Zn-ribbon protein
MDESTPPVGSPAEEQAKAIPSSIDEAAAARQANLLALMHYWKGHDCPVCGVNNQWKIGDLTDIPARNPGAEIANIIGSTQVFSAFPIYCNNCGYTHFINQNILRASVKRREEESRDPEPAPDPGESTP